MYWWRGVEASFGESLDHAWCRVLPGATPTMKLPKKAQIMAFLAGRRIFTLRVAVSPFPPVDFGY
ncbi:MAG: hypothetical protein Q8L09_03670 [Candidatus Moranbacteria bacterium]|nr:hypothetical protein [Candidatus Moranbacteria bacterium]